MILFCAVLCCFWLENLDNDVYAERGVCGFHDIFKNREKQGHYHNLIQEMRLGDREYHFRYFFINCSLSAIVAIFICVDFSHLVFHTLYFRYMYMSPESFDHLLSSPIISKVSTNYHETISAGAHLAITVRFLAFGESQQSLSLSYIMGKTTVSYIVRETCDAI